VLLGITVSTFYVDGLQYTVPAFLPFLLLISLAYWRVRAKGGMGESAVQSVEKPIHQKPAD
jgi:hypothetical protein